MNSNPLKLIKNVLVYNSHNCVQNGSPHENDQLFQNQNITTKNNIHNVEILEMLHKSEEHSYTWWVH